MTIREFFNDADALADILTVLRMFAPKLLGLKAVIMPLLDKEGPKVKDAVMGAINSMQSAKSVAAKTFADERLFALCLADLDSDNTGTNFRQAWRKLDGAEQSAFRELLLTGPDDKLTEEGKIIVRSAAKSDDIEERVERIRDIIGIKIMALASPTKAIAHIISRQKETKPGPILSVLHKVSSKFNTVGDAINEFVTAPTGVNGDGPSLHEQALAYEKKQFEKLLEDNQ